MLVPFPFSSVWKVRLGDPFPPKQDALGPFSDAAAVNDADPFTFPSSISVDMEESSFEGGFEDFGDFQSGGNSELTPTTGSWTFASRSSTDEAGVGVRSV